MAVSIKSHKPEIFISKVTQSVLQVLRWIPPGRFLMGSPESEAGRDEDETQHEVILTKGFWLADTVTTQELWQAVMGNNPSEFKAEERPVESVSWEDCQQFLAKINQVMPGLELRLPTEAQWEYACRAGSTTPFWFGKNITPEQVNYDGNYPYTGGKKGKYRSETVGSGNYRVTGGVYIKCTAMSGSGVVTGIMNYPKEEFVIDPEGPAKGGMRVLRGGSWIVYGRNVRSAYRIRFQPSIRNRSTGFRLARGQEEQARRQA